MIVPYLPPELWYTICKGITPLNIIYLILSVNKENQKSIINISYNLTKYYYQSKGPSIERLFILKCNISHIDSKSKWMDEYFKLKILHHKNEIEKEYNGIRRHLTNMICDKKNKKMFGHITYIKFQNT